MSNLIIESSVRFMGESFQQDKEYSALAKQAGVDSIKADDSKSTGDHAVAAMSHLRAVQALHKKLRGMHIDSDDHNKIEKHHRKIAEHLLNSR